MEIMDIHNILAPETELVHRGEVLVNHFGMKLEQNTF
jgi:hypothetical protein